jgi:hypothetical protein
VSAIWGHVSKLLLQKREEKSKERLSALEAELKANLAKIESDLRSSQNLLQAKIDRSVFVTRAHFETEFEAMKQVFAYLSQLQIGLNGLRPMVTVETPGEGERQRVTRLFERLEKVFSAYNDLLAESEAKAPFYPAELYDAIEECERAAWMEINSVRTSGANMFGPTWYEEGERNRGRFSKAYRRAGDIIRDRISRLAILPG